MASLADYLTKLLDHSALRDSPDSDVLRTDITDIGGYVVFSGADETAARPDPELVGIGTMFYDTTMGQPLWSDGTVWRDAAGSSV